MNVHFATLGCRLNEAEAAAWAREVEAAGHRAVPAPAQADLVVVNTCAVTAEAGRKSRKLLSRLRREAPRAQVVATGCFAELTAREGAGLMQADRVVRNIDKERLPELLSEPGEQADEVAHQKLSAAARTTRPVAARRHERETTTAPARTRAFVKVQDGCRHHCTFCIVTVARGAERSRPVAEIVAQVADLHHRGFEEVVLSGVHLGGYGADIGGGLTDLISSVLDNTAIRRLRLSSLEPWNIPPHMWDLWRNKRLCPHLHLPLQSGSNRVLRRMGRRCSREGFERLVGAARATIPNVTITTDLMVGFPGETETDFEETLAVARSLRFAHVHVFPYSPRPGTVAARMSPQIDAATKRRRKRTLISVAQETRQKILADWIGHTRPVLWESVAAERPDGYASYSGLTDNYLRVESGYLPPPSCSAELSPVNRILPTRIDGVIGGDRLTGTVLAQLP